MSKLYPFNPGSGSQIVTKTELDNGSHNERRILTCVFSRRRFAGEFNSTLRIGFREVDARAEPIVFVIAWLKRFAGKPPLANLLAAAVITKDGGCRKAMQGLAVLFRELTRFGEDTGLY